MMVATLVTLVAAGTKPAAATPDWYDGACTDDDGVTVVIDFGDLGGGVNTRCAPGPVDTGLDALNGSGVAWEGTLQYPGVVCRIAGKPGADDEACGVMPSSNAYWSYWVAPRGGEWCYSNFGAGNRNPPEGTVEGWSFSLNAGSEIPPPGIDPPAAISSPTPAIPANHCTAATASSSSTTTTSTTSTTSTTTSTTSTTLSPATTTTTAPTVPSVTSTSSTTTAIAPTSTSTTLVHQSPIGTIAATTAPSTIASTVASTTPSTSQHTLAPPDSATIVPTNQVDLSDPGSGRGGVVWTIIGLIVVAALAAFGVAAARQRAR